jgi:circadian clock protein KaiC
LGGGFPPNALYLLQGEPGVGKTTLAIQFLLAGAKRSEACLYITFSETREELFVVARSHDWSLDGIRVLELSSFAQWLTAETENTLFDPADIEIHDVTKIIFAEVERIDPRRVVFDSMSELRLLAQSPLRYRRQILGIKQFLAERSCTTLLLDDRTSVESRDDRQLESVCHGVIALRREEHSAQSAANLASARFEAVIFWAVRTITSLRLVASGYFPELYLENINAISYASPFRPESKR